MCVCVFKLLYSYLKDSDDSPEQGVKVLPVRHRVSCLCFQTELTTEDMHSQDTATQVGISPIIQPHMLSLYKSILHLFS